MSSGIDLRYPPVSRPAGDFGPYRREPVPAAADGIVWPAPSGRVDVLCARPLHHALEFSALYRRLRELRSRAPEADVSLWLRSALVDDAPFAALPADRIRRLGDGLPESPLEIDPGFAACGRGETACAAAADRFHAALAAASPRWLKAPGAPATEPRRLLIHQSRFRVGDTLWLTPLLRAVRRRFPAAAVTVVAGPLARQVLARNPHIAELVVWDPAGGEEERRRVLAHLSRSVFDAALFALVRREKSRWLAEAAAERGIPCRVNLEYFDAAEDGRAPSPLFTHEAWFFWGTLASPALLLHALAPWGDVDLADRRVELAADALHDSPGDYPAAPFTVLAPAGHSSDRWPPERFAALGARLAAEFGHSLLLEGAPADEPLLREVERGIARSGAAVRVATDPLGRLAALLARASLLVANDSAPIHVAEAAGTPTLYFSHHEKLVHSHPAGAACWALFDEEKNRIADITAEQALAAVRAMAGRGLLKPALEA